MPLTRALQRDEAAIAGWRANIWRELMGQAERERRTLIFMDESGFYLLPCVVRTYAPRESTPVLTAWQTRDHLSVMGGLTPQGQIRTLVRPESLNGLNVIDFLVRLQRTLDLHLLVVWDGSPIHRR